MALWIVDLQPARRLAQTEEPILAAIRATGHEAVETVYDSERGQIPLELAPLFESGRPLILWGSVGFASWAHDRWNPQPGAFRSERLHAAQWLPIYGDLALNAGAVILTYAEFNAQRAELEARWGGPLFIKPADGGKLISGLVLEPGRPLFDAHYHQFRRWTTPADNYRLLIAPVLPLLAEWRFVIVTGQVITSSQYKIGTELETAPGAPEGARLVAEAIARHSWQPADTYIADVAQTEDGYRLLELNTFGTAGLYDCDLDAVVKAVTPLAESGAR